LNFVGKFEAKLNVDGSGFHPEAHHHADSGTTHAPSDAIIVPDADLLFKGDFRQSGVDLIVSRDDHEWVVQDYFKGEKRAALASPDGARLTGDIVNALTGHVEVAQADGSAGAGKVIGHVTKLVGTATAIRNGVSIILNQGDNVEKGDVVQSGSGSTLGVSFIDGTVFGLSSNARMVLNEMVYDPNGSDNSSLISLVAGTISFVAGQTAKHGDMKIDTPVATMGIRGTAVLVEINFDVPGQNGAPEAKFQVLVEPDGTTGSYILFDKNTLAPIAIVDKAGQQVNVSNNNVSFSDSPLSPELQKLITDVFSLKFTDNTNPQTFTHFTDTLIPQQTWLPVQFANGAAPAVVHVAITPVFSASGPSFSTPLPDIIPHINQPPAVIAHDSSLTAFPDTVGNSVIDTASGTISFADINLGDRPTATATFASFTYQNAQQQNITATLNALQLADIKALEVPLVVVQAPGNSNDGTATWTYSVPNTAVEFLSAGETLTLTYVAEVDSNFPGGNLVTHVPFTITITGTNDAPVITTGPDVIAFSGGIHTHGGDLTASVPTSGTFSFVDVNLDDTHTVTTKLASAALSGPGVAPDTAVPPGPLRIFETALTARIATDSTGTGNGTIDWSLASLPAYLADFIRRGDTLTLTYAVTVTDSQNATSTQDVTVTITGTGHPAVVWIDTTPPPPSGALWSDASNWETGTVPTATDDVIIVTHQLIGLTPTFPVTVNAPAFAQSLTMNDFGTPFTNSPTLSNHSSLTVGAGGIRLHADAIIENFGTISVGGLAEVLHQASLQNWGLLKLAQGGDFTDHSTIANFASGTIEVAGGTLNVLVDIANSGTVSVDPNATLTLQGASIDGGAVTNNGTFDSTGVSAITDAEITNSGLIESTGGVLTIDAAAPVTLANSGTLEADGGTLVIGANVTVTGNSSVTITHGGVAEFAGSSSQMLNLSATFSGTGTLILGNSQHYGGAIGGFAAGDTIDLTDLTYSSSETDVWNGATDTLTIHSGTLSASLIFLGAFGQNSFALTSDANGGTEVVSSPAQASLSGLDSADNAVNGSAVTASLTDANASGVTYTWLENGQVVQSGSSQSFTPGPADIGKVLDVVIGFTDGGHSEQVTALAGTVAAPPVVSFSGGAVSADENSPLTLNGLSVSFADAGTDTIQVTLDVNDGTLALAANTTGVGDSGIGTIGSPLILTGTLAAIDTALDSGIVYTPNSGFTGIDKLSVEASDGIFHSNTASLTIDVAPPTVTIDVLTPNGLDFHNLLAEVGAGTIQSGGSSTSFTIVDAADNLEFVFDGSNFSYGSGEGGITVTGGTLTSVHEFTNDATPAPLADFTTPPVDAATVIADVQLAAAGNFTAVDALISTVAYNFIGGSGPDTFTAAGKADTLSGTGVDVFDGGGAPSGSHDTLTGGAGSTFVFAQGYGALTITNFDQANGAFDSTEGDQIQLNGLSAPSAQNVSFANGNAMLDFGNGDVVTLLNVTQAEYQTLAGSEFTGGGSGGNGNAASTIVASGPNQILTGNAASDTFAFNFTGVGQTTVTDFHPATDTLQFGSQLFANLQAALNATHDDGHGDTVIALDAHDTITLNGVLKAQLQASDFHFV
jgi:VCBS repeat-containing protein